MSDHHEPPRPPDHGDHGHHGHHGHPPRRAPGGRNGQRNGLFAIQVVGPAIYGLIAHPPETREQLKAIIAARSPADAPLLEEVLQGSADGVSVRRIVWILAARKSCKRYAQMVEEPEMNGAHQATTAVVLPLPPHLEEIVEEACPDLIFLLRDHPLPPHLDYIDARTIPTKPREVRELFQPVTSVAFEGCFYGSYQVHTRVEIVDLLETLEDSGLRPRLLVHPMPHHPPEESFAAIGEGWTITEL